MAPKKAPIVPAGSTEPPTGSIAPHPVESVPISNPSDPSADPSDPMEGSSTSMGEQQDSMDSMEEQAETENDLRSPGTSSATESSVDNPVPPSGTPRRKLTTSASSPLKKAKGKQPAVIAGKKPQSVLASRGLSLLEVYGIVLDLKSRPRDLFTKLEITLLENIADVITNLTESLTATENESGSDEHVIDDYEQMDVHSPSAPQTNPHPSDPQTNPPPSDPQANPPPEDTEDVSATPSDGYNPIRSIINAILKHDGIITIDSVCNTQLRDLTGVTSKEAFKKVVHQTTKGEIFHTFKMAVACIMCKGDNEDMYALSGPQRKWIKLWNVNPTFVLALLGKRSLVHSLSDAQAQLLRNWLVVNPHTAILRHELNFRAFVSRLKNGNWASAEQSLLAMHNAT
ncbi:TPA_asm: hypothetical protein [Powellomyces chytrid fungus MELD virus 1]|nr:TPA_asm: hypothetical protein [Powellomyces chytrid fungus MELD virus 1]